ncbi:MAG: phosphoglycerate kinase [Pelagibacterales bacterium]|nr:phosphoglycerate kinase [Pelagibacterales bacterium]
MKLKTIEDIDVSGKVVLVRCDFNVPINDEGEISDISRIERHAPTIITLVNKGAKVALLSHFGRPVGKVDEDLSLGFISESLTEVFKAPEIVIISDCIGNVVKQVLNDMTDGQIGLLENVRFYEGEENNDSDFSKSLADIADIYVNDAFSVCHREHASVYGITNYLPSYAGFALQLEIEMLEKSLRNSEPPMMAIIGGSKVSTKLKLLGNLVKKMKFLAIGGGMANTFLAAQGKNIGASFYEKNMIEEAKSILEKAKSTNCDIILPIDAVVANKLEFNVESFTVNLNDIVKENMILDVGEKTVDLISNAIINSKTLLWNGPLGVFEIPPFDQSTTSCA